MHYFSVATVKIFFSWFSEVYDVHRSSYSLYFFILWFVELLESIDLYLVIDFGNLGHYYFFFLLHILLSPQVLGL